jgi:uncharacterized membrane protein
MIQGRIRQPIWHYGWLAVVLTLGTLLRFWQLDSKPLWLDEIITALFSLGRSYHDVPLNVTFPAVVLDQLFTFNADVSCTQIAHRVTTESVHPPLFFCLLYHWMGWLGTYTDNWIWALRALPALWGVGAIATLYHLNRIAFSPTAGLTGAALMAVSPFAVYLAQEARHYTLPMLLIGLSLAGLVQMQQDLQRQQLRPFIWLGWIGINSLGFYVHYFFSMALVAQILALTAWMLWQRRRLLLPHWGVWGFAIAGIGLSYLPWLPIFLSHMGRPETDWLRPYDPDWRDRLAPLYQTLINWILMVIALPVEEQPLAIAIPSAITMLLFAVWLTWQLSQGLQHLWQHPAHRHPLLLLVGFTLSVLAQFFAIVYILNKDITVVPRYNFIYYPAVYSLLAAGLVQRRKREEGRGNREQGTGEREQGRGNREQGRGNRKKSFLFLFFPLPYSLFPIPYSLIPVLLAGTLSSIIVVHGLAFQKPYYPAQIAKTMNLEPAKPLMLVVSYRSLQEVALGLSFALELRHRYPEAPKPLPLAFAFLHGEAGNHQIWKALPRLDHPLPLPLNLWIVASPSLRKRDFPDQLRIANSNPAIRRKGICQRDPNEVHRLGFPYQLYRCN